MKIPENIQNINLVFLRSIPQKGIKIFTYYGYCLAKGTVHESYSETVV